MQEAIVNVNGVITDGHQAQVSIFDRGFLYGDSLYEVCRTINGKIFQCEEHLERLNFSATLCKMKLDQSNDKIASELQKTVDAFTKKYKNQEIYLRLIVTRGRGKIGFGLKSIETQTQFFIIAMPLPTFSDEYFQRGMKLCISSYLRNHPRALNPAMKSGNYLNNILAYLEAEENGFDDALLLNGDAHITEGTTFNIFYVKNGTLFTPPLDIGILHGITRKDTIEIAKKMGIHTQEVRFPVERLYEADEIFASGTVRCIFPVTQINEQKINKGKPGDLTLKLYHAYQKWSLSQNN